MQPHIRSLLQELQLAAMSTVDVQRNMVVAGNIRRLSKRRGPGKFARRFKRTGAGSVQNDDVPVMQCSATIVAGKRRQPCILTVLGRSGKPQGVPGSPVAALRPATCGNSHLIFGGSDTNLIFGDHATTEPRIYGENKNIVQRLALASCAQHQARKCTMPPAQ